MSPLAWLRNPWGRPRFLPIIVGLYVIWSVVPVLIALPMFGDYYTPDLMSGSPKTAMLGNTINNYVQGGPDKALGAAMTLLLSAFLLVFMLYYLRELRRET